VSEHDEAEAGMREAQRAVAAAARMGWLLQTMGTPLFVSGFGRAAGVGGAMLIGGGVPMAYYSTAYSQPEVALGLVPFGGASHRLAQCDAFLGSYVALTGAPLEHADLVASGLCTASFRDYCNDDDDMSMMSNLAEQYGGMPLLSRLVGSLRSCEDTELARQPPTILEQHTGTLRRCFSLPTVAQIIDALHNETGDSADFAHRTAALMQRHCPLASGAALRLQRELRGASLADGIRLEARVALRLLAHNDVMTHVRARLDHNAQPQWRHASHAAVGSDEIAALFEAPAADSDEARSEAALVAWRQEHDAPTSALIGGPRPMLWFESPRARIAAERRRQIELDAQHLAHYPAARRQFENNTDTMPSNVCALLTLLSL
jgi:enoyl-CoA hydratase/carnithine racemase